MISRKLRQPHAALADLCDGFFDDLAFVDDAELVESSQLPAAARELLDHREHMTTRLRRRFGDEIDLHVLASLRDGDDYARKILLNTREARPRVVELGVVRLSLALLPPSARDAVVAGRMPLGDILIAHDVLRRISPRWFFRFREDSAIAAAFGEPRSPVYGRVGTIFCNEEPAIDVLEVVRGE